MAEGGGLDYVRDEPRPSGPFPLTSCPLDAWEAAFLHADVAFQPRKNGQKVHGSALIVRNPGTFSTAMKMWSIGDSIKTSQ